MKIRRKIKYLRHGYRYRALVIFFVFFTDFIVHSNQIKTIVSLNNCVENNMALKPAPSGSDEVYKYKIYPHYAKLFQNAQKNVCKNNAIGQFDRYGREGVKIQVRRMGGNPATF